jgi:hypothetical protein
MIGLFRARLPIDDDEFDWMLACFRWFELEFAESRRLRPEALTLPDAEAFPPSRKRGHARAIELFDAVRQRAGMADWECDLVPGEAERKSRVTTGLGLKHIGKSAPLGTFAFVEGRYRITYNPSELERPQSLIATFAHELAHFLLHTARTPSPAPRSARTCDRSRCGLSGLRDIHGKFGQKLFAVSGFW